MMQVLITLLVTLMPLVVSKEKPFATDKAGTARWLASENYMGALATFSTWTDGYPFTQVTSFAEGAEGYPGVMYFYQSDMDTSMIDVSKNANVSFSLTEATLEGRCRPSENTLDPESPPCAKATFQGAFVQVPADNAEFGAARKVLLQKHPVIADWPDSHDWKIWKVNPVRLWVIDIYGGAADVDVNEYYAHA